MKVKLLENKETPKREKIIYEKSQMKHLKKLHAETKESEKMRNKEGQEKQLKKMNKGPLKIQ